jgi:hypothetical protein
MGGTGCFPFQDFYDRLANENGRPGKVALVAVVRKILVTANPVARNRQPWRAASQSQPTLGPASRPGMTTIVGFHTESLPARTVFCD